MNELNLENWLPMEPAKGPPLPRFLGITWPWYKEGVPTPPAPSEPLKYSCPYCDQSFATLQELIDHAAAVHPEKPPRGGN
jgi:hypothetical protein